MAVQRTAKMKVDAASKSPASGVKGPLLPTDPGKSDGWPVTPLPDQPSAPIDIEDAEEETIIEKHKPFDFIISAASGIRW